MKGHETFLVDQTGRVVIDGVTVQNEQQRGVIEAMRTMTDSEQREFMRECMFFVNTGKWPQTGRYA